MKSVVIFLIFISPNLCFAQDSLLIAEVCDRIGQDSTGSKENQLKVFFEEIENHIPEMVEPLPKGGILQGLCRYQFRLSQGLTRHCKAFLLDPVISTNYRVVDIESLFDKSEIDTLQSILNSIKKEKELSVHLVTVDDFFPEPSIDSFSIKHIRSLLISRHYDKGTVLVVISKTNRQVRTSTDWVGQTFLTDNECKAINQSMIPFFKREEYLEGVKIGLVELIKRI
jgi:hypothetical protein